MFEMKVWGVNPWRLAVVIILCLWFVAIAADRVSKNYISTLSGLEALETPLKNSLLIDALLEKMYPGAQIYTLDGIYRLGSLATLQDWLDKDKTNEIEYVEEFNDCDDLALRLRVMAQQAEIMVGVLTYWTSETAKHTINICIIKENDHLAVYEIETQSDEVTRRDNPLQGAEWIIY